MISFRTVLNVLELQSEDIAYSKMSEDIIGLKLDIERVCNALNINKENITIDQARLVAKEIKYL